MWKKVTLVLLSNSFTIFMPWKVLFLHFDFIIAGKGSNMKSLPLLHYHQSISSSTQDPNPTQGKIFLRLKTRVLLLFLVVHQIVSTLGKHSHELKIEAHTFSAFPRVNNNNKYLLGIYSWKKKKKRFFKYHTKGIIKIFHGNGVRKKYQNQMLPNPFPMTYHQA